MAKLKETAKNLEIEVSTTAIEPDAKISQVLKNFKFMKEAYVTAQGGVFDVATPSHLLKGATLYKNPYFKL